MLSGNKAAHRYGQEVQQRPGGPFRQQDIQWKSHSDSDWDDVIGPSIDSIPASQIPVVRKKSSKPQSFANCNPLTGLICAWCSFLFTVKLPFVRLSSFCCSFLWSFTTAFLRVWSCVPQSRWNIFVCKILKTFPSISNRGSNRFYVLETGQYRNHYPV